MTKYQKIIYKTAKLICKRNGDYYSDKNLRSCYKSRMRESKSENYPYEKLKKEYDHEQKWNRWFNKFEQKWDEQKGRIVWLNKITGDLSSNKDWKEI